MILHLPCGHRAKHHSEKQTFTCLLLLSRPCTADWLRLHPCPGLSYLQPLISRLCLVLSDSLHFCTDVCQRSAWLSFSSGAETACGSVAICWPKTNKLPHRDTFPLCYAAVNVKGVFLLETTPALPGAASAGPSLSSCFSLKLPSRKMATSARLEVKRTNKVGRRIDIWSFQLAKCKIFHVWCVCSERYRMAFKIVRTESRLVRGILANHGFHEVISSAKSCRFESFAQIL